VISTVLGRNRIIHKFVARIARAGAVFGLMGLAGCTGKAPTETASAPPSRRAGLWEQSLMRDGKPGRLGGLKICLDAATDRKISVFGRHFGQGACQRQVTHTPDGVYRFSSTCTLDNGAQVKAMGTATGDFATHYTLHSQVDVTGAPLEPMNGMHEVVINADYQGPCPAGMRPGDVRAGSVKINLDRLPQAAGLLGGG
jgi:hypothetical protein